jgi:hypothetical protein
MGCPAGNAIGAQLAGARRGSCERVILLRPRRVPKAVTTPVLGNSEPKIKANLKQMILLLPT